MTSGHLKRDVCSADFEKFENWREEDWAADGCEEKSDSTNTSSTGDAAVETSTAGGHVIHKICNTDTLAGIAIRYNVPIADIRRANGLLGDHEMYGRHQLIIPVKGLPIREEIAFLMAQVVGGYGRDPVLDSSAALHPATAAASRVACTLHLVDKEDSSPSGRDEGGVDLQLRWPSQGLINYCYDELCTGIRGISSAEVQDDREQICELNTSGVTSQWVTDASLRKRGGAAHGDPTGGLLSGVGSLHNRLARSYPSERMGNVLSSLSAGMVQGKDMIASLTQAIADMPLVQRITEATSQPAPAPVSGRAPRSSSPVALMHQASTRTTARQESTKDK